MEAVDPYANSTELKHEYGFGLTERVRDDYDAVIVAVSHKPYYDLREEDISKMMKPKGILIDVKGIFRNKIKVFEYWSL